MMKFLCGECIHNSDKGGGCLIPKNLGYVDNCNRYLPKDKPIVQTNEEWIKQCTTEQLAEILVCMAEDKSEAKTVHKENVGKCVWWLKQPHQMTTK